MPALDPQAAIKRGTADVRVGPIAVMRTGVTVESEPKKPVHTFNSRAGRIP